MKTPTTDSEHRTDAAPVTNMPAPSPKSAPLWLVATAFAAVYLIWGSTYLGIRYAVESIPPFLMAGARHLAAGALLFAFVRLRGAPWPTWLQWRDATIAGALLLLVGNGGVSWAELRIPSSLAALLAALTPLWMVLLDWMRPGGVRPRPMVGLGLLFGICGVALLARGHGETHSAAYAWSLVMMLAASICWAMGSVFNRTARKPTSPLMGVAMQMIAGAILLFLVSSAAGEWKQFHPAQVTLLSFGALLYLSIAGSLIGYTAYIWLLNVSTPARVSTYAYVNPLIAVLLGCTLGREVFSHELFVAGGLIIVAVVLIVRGGAKSTAPKTAPARSKLPGIKASV